MIRALRAPLCRWLGVLMLLVRMLAPAGPVLAAPGDAELAALFPGGLAICHVAGADDPAAPAPVPQHDCQLCLACHLHGHLPLLPTGAVAVPGPRSAWAVARAVPPPPVGPPLQARRRATPPIGPPVFL